ncbi:MAG: MBL fold metallo-hydrolase [Candidatus Limnocylindria bacterium]
MSDTVVVRDRGDAERHADPRIEAGAFGPWRTNAYLIWDGRSPEALVFDPGMGAAAALTARAGQLGLTVQLVADSHGHIDHVYDNAAIVAATGADLAIHPDDAYRLAAGGADGWHLEPSRATRDLSEGDRVTAGALAFVVLHMPGHTEGSVCLYEERHRLLLSGDTLFRGSWGRTDLAGGDDRRMVASLSRLARDFPHDVRVLPGHGEETTIGAELAWLERVASSGRLLPP